MMTKIVKEIIANYSKHQNPEYAVKMSKYMKNLFPFLGIRSPERRELLKALLKVNSIKNREELETFVLDLFALNEREYHYTAIDILVKYKKLWTADTLQVMENLVVTKSWWDTVDLISSQCIGTLFVKYPNLKEEKIAIWATSFDMWLNRTAIIYQLTYKDKTDTALLKFSILEHIHSKEFFHQKAIGWALRQYAKYNELWVRDFVDTYNLKPLSRREALKHLK